MKLENSIEVNPYIIGGKPVFPIGLGCLQFTDAAAKVDDPDRFEYQKIVLEAYKLGVNLFDIADFYGITFGECERFMGKAFDLIKQHDPEFRNKCVITSKGGVASFSMERGIEINNTEEYLKQACVASLKRLNLDFLDLYYLHRWDGKTPVNVIMDALVSLVKEGLVKHIGLSEVDPKFLAEAYRYAMSVHGIAIAAIQPEYSLVSREIEKTGVKEIAEYLGIAIIPYGSVSRGLLTAKYNEQYQAEGFVKYFPRFQEDNKTKQLEQLSVFTTIVSCLGCSQAQLSLSWLLHQGNRIMPIPATTNLEHLRMNVEAVKIRLNKDILKLLDQTYPVGLFAARYPNGSRELEYDAIWIKKYQFIKDQSVNNKLKMSDVRNVVTKSITLTNQSELSVEKLTEILREVINWKLITAMQGRNFNDYVDGILSASIVLTNAQQAKQQAAVGFRCLDSLQSDVTYLTPYRVASFSKFILMNIIMRLMQNGALTLNDTVAKRLPNMADQIPSATEITIAHLLSHHSGLRDKYFGAYRKSQPLSCLMMEELASIPGSEYYYCNANYVIIGHIIEAISSDSLVNQFKTLVAEPCQLTNTQLITENDIIPSNAAVGYKFTGCIGHYTTDVGNNIWAAGSFYSTTDDMSKIFRCFFEHDDYIHSDTRKIVEQSCKPVIFEVKTNQDIYRWPAVYGYGIEMHSMNDGAHYFGSGGWLNGSAVFVAYLPSSRIVCAFACSKTQCAYKHNLSKLTSGMFFRPGKNINSQSEVDGERSVTSFSNLN